MSIDYRHSCDKCGKSLIDDGTEIYCADCFAELRDQLDDANREIERLRNLLDSEKGGW